MEKVSIVMPVYNDERYLSESIDSILRQTYKEWELIIVCEFGTNSLTKMIINNYQIKDTHIKVIFNESRLGIAASLNKGIDMATGEYIARMDADDISMPDRLARQVEFLNENQNIDICGIKPTIFGEADYEWKVESDPQIIKSCLLFFTPFVHPTVMMRADSIKNENYRYDASYRYTEDYEFFERTGQNLTFSNIQDSSLFKYRVHSQNATNTGGMKGIELYKGITQRALERYNLYFTEDEIGLLCIHTSPYRHDVESVLDDLIKLDLLLKKIFWDNSIRNKLGINNIFYALHCRWIREWENKYSGNTSFAEDGRIKATIDRGLFMYKSFYKAGINKEVASLPLVSVVMPTYHSEKYVQETIYSLLLQTYSKFELIVVNEFGSDDRTVELIKMFNDPRIKIVQNDIRLGLAESLNKGIKVANGEYIARADADDLYKPERIEKQIQYLISHKDISMCGTWQQYFGNSNYVHRPVLTPEEFKAQTLFTCDMCHSTIVFRKKDFIDNNLFYDSAYLSEDYELWTRAVKKLRICNIPEILGEYRCNGENITASKMDRLDIEAQHIIARNLLDLGIKVNEDDMVLLSGWYNPFIDKEINNVDLLRKEKELLNKIISQNKKIHVYENKALREVVNRRLAWAMSGDQIEKIGFADNLKKRLIHYKHKIQNPVKMWLRFSQKYIKRSIWDSEGHLHDHLIENKNNVDEKAKEIFENQQKLIDEINEQKKIMSIMSEFLISENAERQNLFISVTSELKNMEESIQSSLDNIITENAIQKDFVSNLIKEIEHTTKNEISLSEKNILQTFDGRIWKMECNVTDMLKKYRWEYWQNEKKVVLIGTSQHSNIGDAAIDIGEKRLLHRIFSENKIIEIPDDEFNNQKDFLYSIISPSDIIFLQGGGNLGNRYLEHENIRRTVINSFPENRIVIMPQTIYFDKSEDGIKELKTSEEIYNRHKRLTIFTRGIESLKFAQEHFPNARSECMLDSAFLLDKQYNYKRRGILLCLRDLDDESGLSEEQYSYVCECVKEMDPKYMKTTNCSTQNIGKEIRELVVDEELEKFASHELVVTDRLHGMIFAIITHTPCIVISSYNQKIGEFYEMIKENRSVVYIDKNIKNLPQFIKKQTTVDGINLSDMDYADQIYGQYMAVLGL